MWIFYHKVKQTVTWLVITNIGIQSVEPMDQRTCATLQKSAQLAPQLPGSFSKVSYNYSTFYSYHVLLLWLYSLWLLIVGLLCRYEVERLEQDAKGCLKIMYIVLELQQAHKYACQPYYSMHTLYITVYSTLDQNKP